MITSTEIKKAIAKVLSVDVKYIGVKKNGNSFNAGVRNEFFIDAQSNKMIDTTWNNMVSHKEYCSLKLKQAGELEAITNCLVEPTANKANFNFYPLAK